MLTFIDSHAHIYFDEYRSDFDGMMARAASSGVALIVCPGTNLQTSRESVALAERYPTLLAAVGVHPHEASSASEDVLQEILGLSAHPRVVAIGEIGLDYHYDYSPRDVQREGFRRQLEIAQKRRLPVVIHSREAWEDTLGIVVDALRADPSWRGRASADPVARGVFHCFPGDAGMARAVIDLGFYISFPGPVTFPDRPSKPNLMAEVARSAPLDRILIETDSPYLTPHPHRGKRNEPAYAALVAERLSGLRERPLEEIAAATSANAANLFGVRVP